MGKMLNCGVRFMDGMTLVAILFNIAISVAMGILTALYLLVFRPKLSRFGRFVFSLLLLLLLAAILSAVATQKTAQGGKRQAIGRGSLDHFQTSAIFSRRSNT
jgi:hypothetical protein